MSSPDLFILQASLNHSRVNIMSSEFAPHSRDEWLTQAKKNLKADDLSALHWEVEPGLWIDPFLTPEQEVVQLHWPHQPPFFAGVNLLWSGSAVMHLALTNAVQRGCQAVWFYQVPVITEPDWDALVGELDPCSVRWGFYGRQADELMKTMRHWAAWLRTRGLEPQRVPSVWGLSGPTDAPQQKEIAKIIFELCNQQAGWSWCVQVPSGLWPSDVLSKATLAQHQAYQSWQKVGWSRQALSDSFVFSIVTDHAFLRTAALLRAWRWVATLLAEYHEVPEMHPSFDLQVKAEQNLSLEQQLIHFTAISLAGALGGANRLSLQAAEWNQGEAYVLRLQHALQILKLESRVTQTKDAWAGSYVMDHLTEQLARLVWDKFLAELKNE